MPMTDSVDPLKNVNWIAGPQSGTLGVADLNIPAGYRFADARGARIILDSVNNPAPDDLIGVLAPASGKWWAILEYSSKGYLKNADITKLNNTKVLKEVLAQVGGKDGNPSITGLNWQSQPAYDAATHSLSWSLQIVTPSAKVLNQTVALLGRHGVLQITAVQPYPITDAPSLKELASNITFKDGEHYTDYQTGDKVAVVGLAELIAGPQHASTAGIFGGGLGAVAVWAYFSLGMCVLGGGLVLFFRRKGSAGQVRVPVQAPVAAASAFNGSFSHATLSLNNGHGVEHSNGNGNGNENGHAYVKVAPAIQSRGTKPGHRNRRKRVFDYPKFYTNVMRELSLHSYGPSTSNGKTNGNGHTNGHSNGHSNGHTNGHANGNGSSNGNGSNGNGASSHETIKSEIVGLIATQKNLIEEQKCLLEQQTRLIEEKRWLIQEQTAFIKGQSEMIDQQQFPLKFE